MASRKMNLEYSEKGRKGWQEEGKWARRKSMRVRGKRITMGRKRMGVGQGRKEARMRMKGSEIWKTEKLVRLCRKRTKNERKAKREREIMTNL